MKDIEISTLELDTRIRKIILSTSKKSRSTLDLHRSCRGSSLASDELPTGLSFSIRRLKPLIGYLILYHYYPFEASVYCYYHLDLQDHLEGSESYWLSVLIEDKELFLKWLAKQKIVTVQQFFAGIVNEENLLYLLETIKFSFEEKLKSPKRVIRRKGYRDKGSRGPDDSRALNEELRDDFYLTLYQFEQEEKIRVRHQESLLLKEHLNEGRVLTDELMLRFRLIEVKKGVQNEQSNNDSQIEDYVKRRSCEDLVRQRRKDQKAKERARIEAIESKSLTSESRKETS